MPNAIGGFYFSELSIGQVFEFERIITDKDVVIFAEVSGDNNPIHLDEDYAKTTIFGERIAHGALTASLISAAIGTKLPGPGCIFMGLALRFLRPVKIGANVATKIEIIEMNPAKNIVIISTKASVNGKAVLSGEATVMVPNK